jgi:hypothetical protein
VLGWGESVATSGVVIDRQVRAKCWLRLPNAGSSAAGTEARGADAAHEHLGRDVGQIRRREDG